MAAQTGSAPSALMIALAWPRSIAVYLFLSLYVLLVGPPALLIAWRFGRPRLLVTLGLAAVRLSREILGLRYDIEGMEHVDGNVPAVFCMNHVSNVDVLLFDVLYRKCPRLKGVYKSELGRLPVLGRVLKVAGFVAVDRGNREQTRGAVERATEMLRRGDSFLVAPEGTRSRTGDLLPFKRGAFVMAIGAQVPVIPVVMLGGRDAMPRGSAVVCPAVLRVRIGAPIGTAGLTDGDQDRLANLVRAQVEALSGADIVTTTAR